MRRFVWLGAFLGLAISAQGCTYEYCPGTSDAQAYIEPPTVVAQTAPPPPPVQVEVRSAQPSVQAVWVDGHYSWEGGRWVWLSGQWQTPRAGYVWQNPVGVQVQGGVRYHPGYWRPAHAEPPPVYRQPSAVPVVVQAQASGGTRGGEVVVVGTGNVQAQPVQSGGTVVVTQPPRANVGVVAAQPGVVATQPGVVAVRPAQGVGNVQAGGTVQAGVRPGTVVGPQQGGNVVSVQPGTRPATVGGVAQNPVVQTRPGVAATVQTGVRPGTVVGPQQGGNVVSVQPGTRPATVGGIGQGQVVQTRPGVAGTVQTGVRPGTVVGPQQQGGVVSTQPGTRPATVAGVGRPGVNVQGGVVTGTQLTCRLGASFAPRGGALVINGTNLNGAVVMIGGSTAPTMSASATQVTVQVPSTSRGGGVTVSAGGQNASCGSLRITGEM